MGRSYKSKYRIEVNGSGPMSWDCKTHGKPTDKALAAWVLGYFRSLEAGGVNGHIGRLGRFTAARVILQGTTTRPDVEVATWPVRPGRRPIADSSYVCMICGKLTCPCGTAAEIFSQVDRETETCQKHRLGLCPVCGPVLVYPKAMVVTLTGFACTHCGRPSTGPGRA